MKILLATPSRPGNATGNAATSGRWARLLRELGHTVSLVEHYDGTAADLLIALHARKSATTVDRFRRAFPGRPVVVGMAGTDLYLDLQESERTRRTVEAATRIVVLQKLALQELPRSVRRRAVVIEQSARPPMTRTAPLTSCFEVLVIANLRAVKDPLRTALATRGMPVESRIRVTHVGAPLHAGYEQRATRETASNPRYRYVGRQPHGRTMRLVQRARVHCLTSKAEGGANVLGDAIACGTPVLASRIDGSLGLLGADYPGLFEVGATAELRELLLRVERDPRFLRQLAAAGRRLAPLFTPAREKTAWRRLLQSLKP